MGDGLLTVTINAASFGGGRHMFKRKFTIAPTKRDGGHAKCPSRSIRKDGGGLFRRAPDRCLR